MKRVAVAGGAGYIGKALVGQLLERGDEVVVIDRFFFGREALESLEPNPRLTQRRVDIRRLDDEAVAGADVVVDLTGLSNDPSCEIDAELTREINVDGTLRLADMAARQGSRFVYSSSCSVYGAGQGQGLTETSPTHPVSLYAQLKLEVERELLERHRRGELDCVILRNATVFGLSLPRMRLDLVVNMMTAYAFEKGKIFVLGGGRQWRPLVHVADVAAAFVRVLDEEASRVSGEIFNVGRANYQVLDVAFRVAQAVPGTVVERVPDDPDRRTYHVDFSKIESRLGFKTRHSLDDGIQEILGALREGTLRMGDRRYRTLDYYKFLLEAERTYRELQLDGRLL
jgi:nucleoside-diphosphate-sugar epimerase